MKKERPVAKEPEEASVAQTQGYKNQQREMAEQREAREFRNAARVVAQQALDAIADYSDITFPLVEGNLQVFPRPSPEDQAAQQGFVVLQESVDQIVAVLYALAAAREQGRSVPQVLRVLVQPYLDAASKA